MIFESTPIMVGPLPGPCVCGSFKCTGLPFFYILMIFESRNMTFTFGSYYFCFNPVTTVGNSTNHRD